MKTINKRPRSVKNCTASANKGGFSIVDIRNLATSLNIDTRMAGGKLKPKAQLCQEIMAKIERENDQVQNVKKIQEVEEVANVDEEDDIVINPDDIVEEVGPVQMVQLAQPLNANQQEEFRREIDFLEKHEVPFTTYRGTPLNEILGLIYLLETYGTICAPLSEIRELVGQQDFDVGDYSLSWYCFYEGPVCQRVLLEPRQFDQNLQRCLQDERVRHVIIPIGMNDRGGRPEGASHSNYLILDKHDRSDQGPNGTIERYEPHGTNIYELEQWFEPFELDQKLTEFFRNYGIKYISPMEYCPYLGLQTLEGREQEEPVGWERGDPGGYCSAWSQYWAALRLQNPDVPRNELLTEAIQHIDRFKKFIRAYSEFLMVKKNEILRGLPDDTFIYSDDETIINPQRKDQLRQHINQKINTIFRRLER